MHGVLGAAVAARLLRWHLVRFRGGKSQAEAAERIGRSQPTIASMERGSSLPTQSNLEILLLFYGHHDAFPMMRELLTAAKSKPVADNGADFTSVTDFIVAIGLEAFASRIEAFEPAVVLGLLQTETYARTLVEHTRTLVPDFDADEAVRIRMARQAVLTRDHQPAELWWVTEERALRRLVGGPEVMGEQLAHLVRMAEQPGITIQVIRDDTALHAAMQGPFTLMSLQDGSRVAYEETRHAVHLYDASEAVDDYAREVDHLRHQALPPTESVELINRLRKELTR
jgi:transcriptional regulator with XRE-family HTH domain